MIIRTMALLVTACALGFATPTSFEGRLNRSRSEAPAAHKKNPSGVSKKVWSPDGQASADSVTSSIGYSMLKWAFGIGMAAVILSLAFGISSSQSAHGHGHSHS